MNARPSDGQRGHLLGLVLAAITVVGLAVGHRSVGYVRDEGIYFEAARSYAAWIEDLARAPGRALDRKGRDRRFRINHEHPALMKLAFGLSGRLLAQPPRTQDDSDVADGLVAALPEGAALRLPAQLLAGLGVFLLHAAGRALAGTWGGILAAGAFILLPRVAFHAGLAAFDVPVAVAIFALVMAYRRALHDWRWGLALGPILGVCIAIKHNALFAPLLFGAHYLACLGLAWVRAGRRPTPGQLAPLPFVSMALLAPLVAIALWPWLWTDTFGRIAEYFAFHRAHAYYNMEFLGTNYNTPPMPWTYPWVMLWATVPTGLLLLAGAGIGAWISAEAGTTPPGPGTRPQPGRWATPLPDPGFRLDGVLVGLFAVFPIALIAWPTTPIFGGTKHFITAYPFLALGAARGLGALRGRSWWPRRWPQMPGLVVAIVLAPAAMATVDGHPHNLSQYAPMVGGPRGAAALGLNRGFWGHSITPLLPELPAVVGERGKLYIHDVDAKVVEQYRREGRWPAGLRPVPIGRADAGLLFHERHMATYEFELWDRLGTNAPAMIVTLDDVPLTSLYSRPGASP